VTVRAGPGPARFVSGGPATSAVRPAVRLTRVNALVTLDFTMLGLTRKNFKICMLLLAAVIALAVGCGGAGAGTTSCAWRPRTS